jgi:hypothetical protein
MLPDAPVQVGRVLEHHDDDTSTVELPLETPSTVIGGGLARGSIIRPRGTTVPVGGWAFVRRGVIETRAPDALPLPIQVGEPAAPPEPPPEILDTFTGAAGTNMIEHDGELNADWVTVEGNLTGVLLTGSGQAQFSSLGGSLFARGNWFPNNIDATYFELEWTKNADAGNWNNQPSLGVWAGPFFGGSVTFFASIGDGNSADYPDYYDNLLLWVTTNSLPVIGIGSVVDTGISVSGTGSHVLRVELNANRTQIKVSVDGVVLFTQSFGSSLLSLELVGWYLGAPPAPRNAVFSLDRFAAGYLA